MKYSIVAIIFFSTNLIIFSNNSDTIIVSKKNTILISDTTHDCKVTTLSKTIYKRVNLSGLNDSSVNILDNEHAHELLLDSIRSITFYGRGFWIGALIGFSIGMATGLIFGGDNISITGDGSSQEYKFGQAFAVGFLMGIPFGLIGGGIGALFAEDKFYDFSKLNLAAKRKKLLYLMKMYSDK